MRVKSLYAIIDSSYLKPGEMAGAAERLCLAGVKLIQLRAKDMSASAVLAAARDIKKVTEKNGALFIINDRLDIAKLSGADGAHLGQDDIPIEEARSYLGGSAIIGISTHNIKEAKEAEAKDASYISFGPVFETKTKKDAESPKGLDALKAVRENISLPIVAIGGITEETAPEAVKAGADSVAIISDILLSKDITAKAKSIVSIFT